MKSKQQMQMFLPRKENLLQNLKIILKKIKFSAILMKLQAIVKIQLMNFHKVFIKSKKVRECLFLQKCLESLINRKTMLHQFTQKLLNKLRLLKREWTVTLCLTVLIQKIKNQLSMQLYQSNKNREMLSFSKVMMVIIFILLKKEF